jgi:Fe-S cluster biogenesis protein NfuA
MNSDLSARVLSALDQVRPYIEMDGGKVALVGVDATTGIVRVSLKGACQGCPSAQATLKGGIERAVKSKAPEIKAVILA